MHHDFNGKTRELAEAAATDGRSRDVLNSIEMMEAQVRDSGREPAPLFMTGFAELNLEALEDMVTA